MSLVGLGLAFSMHPGGAQLLLLAVGIFFAAGISGPAGAMVANLTHESIRATAFGTLTLANNLLGLAAGPLVTGILADKFGLVRHCTFRSPGRGVGALIALRSTRNGSGERARGHLRKSRAPDLTVPDDRAKTSPRRLLPGMTPGTLARHVGQYGRPHCRRPDPPCTTEGRLMSHQALFTVPDQSSPNRGPRRERRSCGWAWASRRRWPSRPPRSGCRRPASAGARALLHGARLGRGADSAGCGDRHDPAGRSRTG